MKKKERKKTELNPDCKFNKIHFERDVDAERAQSAYRNYYECHVNVICFHFQYVMSEIYPGFKFVMSSIFFSFSLFSLAFFFISAMKNDSISDFVHCSLEYMCLDVHVDDIKMGTQFKSQHNTSMGCDVNPIENCRKTNESWNCGTKKKMANLCEQQNGLHLMNKWENHEIKCTICHCLVFQCL